MRIHLIMPMGGKGSRFSGSGFDVPKPLIELHGRPFFFWAVQSVARFVPLLDITFVVLEEHVARHRIDARILQCYPEARIVTLSRVLNGAVLTCLEGARAIEDGAPLLFNDCDHMFRSAAFERFLADDSRAACVDGGLLTFPSDEPKYSFLQYDAQGNVVRTVEKQVISSDAICGAYYFRTPGIFRSAAEEYLRDCDYQEYFMSGLYNVMARRKMIVKGFPTDFHVPFGVPEEYEEALHSDRFEALL